MLSGCIPSFSAVLNIAPFPTLYHAKKKILSAFFLPVLGRFSLSPVLPSPKSLSVLHLYYEARCLRFSLLLQVVVQGHFKASIRHLKLSHTELNSISLCRLNI